MTNLETFVTEGSVQAISDDYSTDGFLDDFARIDHQHPLSPGLRSKIIDRVDDLVKLPAAALHRNEIWNVKNLNKWYYSNGTVWTSFGEASTSGFLPLTGGNLSGGISFTGGGQVIAMSPAASYMAWFNGPTRLGYLQGNAGGLILSSETGVLSLTGTGGLNLNGGRVDFGGNNLTGFGGSITVAGTTYTMQAGAWANSIALRNGSGQIYVSHLNSTADVVGGYPVYMAGQNGDNFLRWYSKSGAFVATQCQGNATSTLWSEVALLANPAAGNAAVALHCGGVAPQIASVNGYGNAVYFRDSVFNDASCVIVSAGIVTDSSKRWKKNINGWPLKSLGAASEQALSLLNKLNPVTYEVAIPDIETPDEKRMKAFVKLNSFNSSKGLSPYELPEHNCGEHQCDGTIEEPCIRYIESHKTHLGFIAEEVIEVVPNAVRLDKEKMPSGINYNYLITLCVAAIKEMTSRLEMLEGAVGGNSS